MIVKILIDDEFKNLIPPLTDEEYKGLEDSIVKEGCRDALILWGNTLIDGHNRYEICTKHNIPFKTIEKEFASRDDALLWMIDNQKSRRNLTAFSMGMLQSKAIEILSKQAKANQAVYYGNQYEKRTFCEFTKSAKEEKLKEPPKPEPKIDTTKELAKRIGTGEQTASRIITINKRIEKAIKEEKPIAGKKPEELKKELMSGSVTINEAYNKIKLEEKKETIKQAERKIVEQADNSIKPVIYIGDSTKHEPKEKYDLLLTDPPYSTDVDNIEEFVNSWLYNALNNVKSTGFAYIFIGAYPNEVRAYLNAKIPEHIELCQQLIWTYKNTLGNNPKDRYKQNYQVCLFYRGVDAPELDCPLTNEQWAVQEINAPDGRQGDRYHAWQKPIEIAERFIRHSTKKDMTIYDPFACTGTFLLAAAKLGRKAYGYEINEDNAKIAIERGCSLAEA
ncbi:DNA modification methylase [Ruminococcus sp.]|uniref:DNA modification methylase n=1 Tax=Ruminococcus sp. TaxID=41978 RepID=UPI001B5B693C|nr:DNA modification methylase [Ruminococcus sp.]MBP5434064.1 DNA modification methylase [Ruminococcus sp.]